MKTQDDIASRLAAVKAAAEEISKGQRYNFSSLLTKRTILPGTYDYVRTITTSPAWFRVTATPASGNPLPLNIDVRFRIGNSDVLAAPDYEDSFNFIGILKKPVHEDGVHVIDYRFVTGSTPETVYFKIIATGLDDYTITVATI